mmetsp:Transcript_107859/g.315302  ORF Transcript_107859/g.315302 Transcript_107859/m.315302 type:complete len:214 (+) Transcript_107859:1395-2036(+)
MAVAGPRDAAQAREPGRMLRLVLALHVHDPLATCRVQPADEVLHLREVLGHELWTHPLAKGCEELALVRHEVHGLRGCYAVAFIHPDGMSTEAQGGLPEGTWRCLGSNRTGRFIPGPGCRHLLKSRPTPPLRKYLLASWPVRPVSSASVAAEAVSLRAVLQVAARLTEALLALAFRTDTVCPNRSTPRRRTSHEVVLLAPNPAPRHAGIALRG